MFRLRRENLSLILPGGEVTGYYVTSSHGLSVIERTTTEIYQLMVKQVARILSPNKGNLGNLGSDDVSMAEMDKMQIPRHVQEVIRASWQRGERHFFGRMDFAIQFVNDGNNNDDGNNDRNGDVGDGDEEGRLVELKMLELNGDTPGGIIDTIEVQEDVAKLLNLKSTGDLLKRAFIDTFSDKEIVKTPLAILHHPGSAEIVGQSKLIEKLFNENGIKTTRFEYPNVPPLSSEYQSFWKMFRWSALLGDTPTTYRFPQVHDFLLEECEFGAKKQIIEPAWAMLLQHKGLLPLLSQANADHPSILKSSFDSKKSTLTKARNGNAFVCKSNNGINGNEVIVVTKDGIVHSHIEETASMEVKRAVEKILSDKNKGINEDDVNDDVSAPNGWIYQEFVKMMSFPSSSSSSSSSSTSSSSSSPGYPVISCWIANGKFAGVIVRESASAITDLNEYVNPLLIK